MTDAEKESWKVVGSDAAPLAEAAKVAMEKSVGDQGEILVSPRLWSAKLTSDRGNPAWEIDIVGLNPVLRGPLRHRFWISTAAARMKHRELVDRFAGEPLRVALPTELPNGLYIYDFEKGDGPEVRPDSKVTVNYRLFLQDNTKLHDTWQLLLPETFLVSAAPLKGMTEGMPGMRAGGRRKIAMPYTFAFGEAATELAPPKALVTCDVEIVDVENP